MTVPVIRALLNQNNSIKITILTRSFFAPFFKEFKNVTIYTPDLKGKHKGFTGLFKLYKELLKLNIDCIADLHNGLRSNILVKLFRLRGIQCVQLDKGRKEKKLLTSASNHKVLYPLKTMHERYAEVFNTLGFSIDLKVSFPITKGNIPNYIKEELQGSKLIGIAPFAAYKSKALPINKIQELIEQVNTYSNVQVLLLGGGIQEKTILDNLAIKYKNVHSVVQKGSFEEELNLISNLDIMVAMDSGNGHIAAIYGIPVVTIWGVTHPYLGFVPFQQPMKHQITPDLKKYPLIPTSVYGKDYPESYLTCFDTIDVHQITSIIHKILNKKESV